MGNEMGNNNTSGLREEDNTVEDKSVQQFDHVDDLKGQNHVVPATLDKDSQGEETEDQEEDNMKTEGKKSPEDAARTDYEKEQNREVVASEDIYLNGNEEKEEDSDMISVDKEKFMQVSGYAEEAKEQDILVPAAEDKNSQGNETESASLEHDGLASPRVEDLKCDENEQDNSTVLEVEEMPLKEGASIDETNAEARQDLASGDESTHGSERESASLEHDGLASTRIEDQSGNEKDEIPSKEGTSTDETNAEARLVPAGGDESSQGTKTGLVFGDRYVMEHPCVDKQNHDEKEEYITINDEGEEQSSQEAASTDVLDGQDQLLAVVEDKATHENEISLVSSDPEGTADLHDSNPKEHDKSVEEDNSMISVDKENSMQEAGYAEEAEGKDLLVPLAEDTNTSGNEMELASLEHYGTASPRIKDQEHYETEQDTSTTLEVKEISSKAAASTDEINAEACLVPAGINGSTHGTETELVFDDRDGMEYPCVDKQKNNDEKEKDITINDEVEEQYSQEAGSAEKAKGEDNLVPAAEDKITQENERELASVGHDGLASPLTENLEHDEKEHDTSRDEIPVKEHASTDETNAGNCLVPAGGDKSTRETETGLVFGDRDGMENPCFGKLKHDDKEEDITINVDAEEQSSEEATGTDVLDIQGQLLAVDEDKTTHGNEKGLVSSEPEGTADLHDDNPKVHEKEVNNTNAEPREKPQAKDDIEEKDPTIHAAEGKDCNNTEAESASSDPMIVGDTLDNQILEGKEQGKTEVDPPAESAEADAKPNEVVCEGSETQPDSSSKNLKDHGMQTELNLEENLSGRTDEIENQNSVEEEDEGTSNSVIGAASSTSHDTVPQEPIVVLEAEEHESTEIQTEQLVLECNGTLKSEDVIIPSLTCQDQENGFFLDSSVSTDPIESVFPDQSPEVGKEKDEFLVKKMEIKERSNEEIIELKDDEFGAKCYGELPSNMNSIKKDFPESQVEATLSDDTQTILVEVSEEKGMVLSQEGITVKEESKNGHALRSHCQIQPGEDSIKKSNGEGPEQGSKADDHSTFSAQFMINGQAKVLENSHLVEQQKDSHQEVQLVIDSIVMPADTFLMNQIYKEEPEEKKIIEQMVQNKNDSNPIRNDTPRRENGEQCISHSYDPIEQAQAFLSTSPFLQALPEKQMHESNLEFKKVENSNESMAEVIANGDYNQRASVGRLSMESNLDNTSTINAPMRKSPSFDLDLRNDARGEDSDQTPLLYQDKATIDSFSSQANVTDHGKPVANTENGENTSWYESIEAEEKGVTLETSDSEKSRTPFIGFLKEEEEAENVLLNPKKQDNDSTTKKTTTKVSVSAKDDVSSVTTKGKVKRKPRTSLFGTCMCCATV